MKNSQEAEAYLNEVKQKVKENIKWIPYKEVPLGGQSCGMPRMKAILYSEDLDLKIEFGYHKSQIRNREACWTLFELMLDDLIK